jgi:hypothetical protein
VRLPSSVAGFGLCEAADLLEGYKSVASPIVSFVLGTTALLLSAVNKFSRSDGLSIPLLCGKSTRCQPLLLPLCLSYKVQFLLSAVWRTSELAALLLRRTIRVLSPFFLLSWVCRVWPL